MDSLNILTPGVAGAVIIGHTFVTKMMQTVMWRGPGSKAASMGVSIDAPSQHTHATHSFFIIFLIPSYLCGSAHNLVVLTCRTLTHPGTLQRLITGCKSKTSWRRSRTYGMSICFSLSLFFKNLNQ